MYGATWTEIGEATSQKTSTKPDAAKGDKDPKTILTLYAVNGASPILLALPNLDTMGGAAVNPVVSQIFA